MKLLLGGLLVGEYELRRAFKAWLQEYVDIHWFVLEDVWHLFGVRHNRLDHFLVKIKVEEGNGWTHGCLEQFNHLSSHVLVIGEEDCLALSLISATLQQCFRSPIPNSNAVHSTVLVVLAHQIDDGLCITHLTVCQ